MNPIQHFQHYFDICIANNKQLLEHVHHIRYQVYCQEIGYKIEQKVHQPKETDLYDTHSQHTLLIYKLSNKPIGCVRLVTLDPHAPEPELPFQHYFAEALDKHQFDPDQYLPGQIAEFSRLAIVSEFRRRSSDQRQSTSPPHPIIGPPEQRNNFPIIPVSLFLAALSMLLNSNAQYGVAMIEPKLMRLLRMFGIHFELVGKTVDYYGLRAPYIIHRDNALRYLKPEISDLFFAINRSLQTDTHQDDNL